VGGWPLFFAISEIISVMAAIKMPTGSVTTYRKHNKPDYGPLGDSTDDFVA
jgi:hypothetical protein